MPGPIEMPSEVNGNISVFDRFAGAAAEIASRAPFFAVCVALVSLWVLQGAVMMAATGTMSTFLDDKFQLEINTTTTIITFLMVALLQNTQTRNDLATQHKLNAIADGLADLMAKVGEDDDCFLEQIRELKLAVGLEEREGTARGDAPDAAEARNTPHAPDTPHPPVAEPAGASAGS